MRNGVKIGEGDGTVSLLSLGAMCVEGWKRQQWNPAGIKITTVEVSPDHTFFIRAASAHLPTNQLPHQPLASIPRGGANTSDHIDILGSMRLNEIVLQVALGVGHEVEDEFVSKIRDYAARIEWD